MAKHTSSADPCLLLHEVLEREFTSLHGKLPADYPSSAEPEIRLKAILAAIHGLKEKRTALCISGGGIRSATFGLGVLQGLARCGLLDKFHYLSTVSGGGYIGSWLSAWVKNHAQGIGGVVAELQSRPASTLKSEPRPIHHLREFSNYLAPRTGLTSVDFWTLITTFIRNMFLNWLVLISWLAAAMMIPRVYLFTIMLEPDWSRWTGVVGRRWNISLAMLLVVGVALIAVAMAYAIMDVPSTGNARLPQRRFLIFRQLPLLLGALILVAWWAVFWNIHYGDRFPAGVWLLKCIGFSVVSYLSASVLAPVIRALRKAKQKARPGRFTAWLLRFLTILFTSAFAGLCLWLIATRMFLGPSKIEFTAKRDCEATQISNGQKTMIPARTQVAIAEIVKGSYTVETNQGLARIAKKDLDALGPKFVPLPAKHALSYVCFAPALILAMFLLVNFVFTGLASKVTDDEDREWWARSAAWILITIVGWIVVNLVVVWGAQAISASPNGNGLAVFLGKVETSQTSPIAKTVLGAFGGITGIVGVLVALRSKLSKKVHMKVGYEWPLVIAAVVFFVLLAIVISWVLLLIGSQPWAQHVTAWLLRKEQYQITDPNSWRVQLFVVFFLTSVTLLFGIGIGFAINANTFSLHATYRNRLIRAYLAPSRSTEARKPHLFTGFDPADDFALRELSPEKPLHVINGTLNLVRGEQLAWQERKAESFTMSRLHCGCLYLGYRPSAEYGHGITLGTALAISGAAANPNMGYHSSPVVGFLLALFNVRLGWWLGNPGSPGAKTWRRSGPAYSVGPLFSEAFGITTDRRKYVNVSDGGHFENLGLYEMVLRRCHYIVVSDAGEDPECTFADLGEAVRKIRIDFGIPIEFERMSIYPRSEDAAQNQKGRNCAIGRICYSAVDGESAADGVLIYIKPACYGNEPRDIYEYFKTNKTFPHESTKDQFFSESQFESYRMLGAHTMEGLCTDCRGDFACFIRDILKTHLKMEAPDWLAKLLGPPAKSGRRSWMTFNKRSTSSA